MQARGKEATLLLVLNAHHDLVQFSLPSPIEHCRWNRLMDTNLGSDAPEAIIEGATYGVTGRCVVLFALGSASP